MARIAGALLVALLVAGGSASYVVTHPGHATGSAAQVVPFHAQVRAAPDRVSLVPLRPGVLSGRVRLAGGPAPGGTLPAGPGTVLLRNSAGFAQRAHVDRDGDWSTSVSSGTYTVVAHIPGFATCPPATVRVVGGQVERVAIYCPVK